MWSSSRISLVSYRPDGDEMGFVYMKRQFYWFSSGEKLACTIYHQRGIWMALLMGSFIHNYNLDGTRL